MRSRLRSDEPEDRAGMIGLQAAEKGNAFMYAMALSENLLCLRRADSTNVYAVELTAPQFSDSRVAPWSRC
jgi:hypothetical protein